MKSADNLDEIINAFEPEALDGKDPLFDKYYHAKTMPSRMGNATASPLRNLERRCLTPATRNAHLLVGHRGCGKSTELNHLRKGFEEQKHPVTVIDCQTELAIMALSHWDMMLVISDALCKIAKNRNCPLPDSLLEKLERFFTEIEVTTETSTESNVMVQVGAKAQTPTLLAQVLELFVRAKGDLKRSSERRETIRKKINHRAHDLSDIIKEINDQLKSVLNDKQPILIFENLDKAPPEKVWDAFSSGLLEDMPFPVIYTFPINAFYEGRFHTLKNTFTSHLLPMIKTQNKDGGRNDEGIEVIREIVRRRSAVDALFDPDALTLLIKKTGGSLRELFDCIIACSFSALDRAELAGGNKKTRIEVEDAQIVLKQLRSALSRRIVEGQFGMLKEIYQSAPAKEIISDREMLLELMQSGAVIEYNGERWCAVHPLIVDYLKEVKELPKEQSDGSAGERPDYVERESQTSQQQ